MRVYGSKRYDAVQCRYGCCTTKYGKHKKHRAATDKSRRRTARQAARKFIHEQLLFF